MPFGISFDPTRIEITSLELAPGVTAMDERLDPEKGFLWLDLQVAEGQATSQSLGSIGITALNAGSAPLVFTCDGAVNGDGFRIPVAAGNGAVFVSIPQGIGGK